MNISNAIIYANIDININEKFNITVNINSNNNNYYLKQNGVRQLDIRYIIALLAMYYFNYYSHQKLA